MVTTVVIFGASGDLISHGFWRRSENLARSIHEGFYYNRRYAATASMTAGGLAARSVTYDFKHASSLLRALSHGVRRFHHEAS